MSRLLFRVNLIALLTIISCFPLSAAEPVTYSGLTYELDEATSSARLIHADPSLESAVIPHYLPNYYEEAHYLISTIAEDAFSECSSLTELIIACIDPDWSLIDIPKMTFSNCPLEKVYIARPFPVSTSTSSPFYGKKSIKSLEIGGAIESISERMFSGCSNVETISLHEVEIIEERAFKDFKSLISVELPISLIEIKTDAFNGCINLRSVVIPSYIEKIGDQAFYNCPGLKDVTYITDNFISGSYNIFSKETYSSALLKISKSSFDDRKNISPWKEFYKVAYGDATIEHDFITYDLDFEYKTARIISVEPRATVVTIPPTVLGPDGATSFDVTYVLGTAFNDCKYLSDLTIADSETELTFGNNPLNYFNGVFGNSPLNQIYVGRKISYADERLFAGQKNVSKLTLGEGLTELPDGLFQGCSGYKSLVIPSGVTHIGDKAFGGSEALEDIKFSGILVSIGHRAFSGCKSLTNIELPPTLQNIGSEAFWDCSALAVVKLPKSLEVISAGTFTDCFSLSSINLSGVQVIGDRAFNGCTSLSDITLPQSLKSIGMLAFGNCSNLTALSFPNQLDSIGGQAFSCCSSLKTVSLPSNVKALGYGAFSYCTSLEEVTIEDSEEPLEMQYRSSAPGCRLEQMFDHCPLKKVYIGRNLQFRNVDGSGGFVISPFYYNREITEVVFGNNVTSIPDGLFESSVSLKSVTLSLSLRHLGANAFYSCRSLEEIIIPNSVITFGASVFSLCSALSHFEIPSSVTEIGKSAFAGCQNLQKITFVKYSDLPQKIVGQDPAKTQNDVNSGITVLNDSIFLNCKELRYIEVPNTVTSISDRAFVGCVNLDSITIPASVISIGNEVFKDCSSLKKIALPASVESIGERCFYQCKELSSVILPANLNNLGKEAFGLCDAISTIKYPASELVASTYDVFTNATYGKAVLNIPTNLIPSAANISPWNNFENIQPIMADSLVITNVANELRKGQTMQLSVIVVPDKASPEVVWESSNPSVASVSETGLVTALTSGTTEISATAADGSGLSDSFTLTVTAPLRGDANDNGKVTITDAVLTSDYIVGKPAIDFCFEGADTNGDGRISISDISRIINIILSEIDD